MTDDIRRQRRQHQMSWRKIVIRIRWTFWLSNIWCWPILSCLLNTACTLPHGSLEGISGHLKGVLIHWKENQLFVCVSVKSRENLKEHCCHSNLQFLIWYLGEIKFFSKIFVESWIYLHSSQINGSKLAISTERRSVNKMSFLSGVSLNFVENSIVCAKFGSIHKFTSCPRNWLGLLPGSGDCWAGSLATHPNWAETSLESSSDSNPASHLSSAQLSSAQTRAIEGWFEVGFGRLTLAIT